MGLLWCVSADQVYGDQEMHGTVRKHCIDYMVGSLTVLSGIFVARKTDYKNYKNL